MARRHVALSSSAGDGSTWHEAQYRVASSRPSAA
jgi:hypothetical protein